MASCHYCDTKLSSVQTSKSRWQIQHNFNKARQFKICIPFIYKQTQVGWQKSDFFTYDSDILSWQRKLEEVLK